MAFHEALIVGTSDKQIVGSVSVGVVKMSVPGIGVGFMVWVWGFVSVLCVYVCVIVIKETIPLKVLSSPLYPLLLCSI